MLNQLKRQRGEIVYCRGDVKSAVCTYLIIYWHGRLVTWYRFIGYKIDRRGISCCVTCVAGARTVLCFNMVLFES